MTHLSLFSGIGGIDLAAHWAGFTTVAFVERDPFCQKVLSKNFPGVPIYDDVCGFDGHPFAGVTLVSGGFPCQPFSFAGKRGGETDDRFLWPEMLRIAQESKPAWVLGENVAGFVGMGLDKSLSDLESIGYEGTAVVLPACAVDAPHRRDRCFILAHSYQDGRLQRIPTAGEGGGQLETDNSRRHWCCDHAEPERVWPPEPRVDRVVNGVPVGMDASRLRAIGNAVVPQQVYPILKAIADQIKEAA